MLLNNFYSEFFMRFLTKTVALFLFLLSLPLFFSSCAKPAKISEYEIVAELDGDTLTGKETVTFYNSYDTSFKELKFNLFPNAFRKDAKKSPVAEQYKGVAYYNGENYGDMEIISVTEGD